jgi:hypothetical protein
MGLINAFRTSASSTRKVADVLGFFLFVANVAFTITMINPLEISIGLHFGEATVNKIVNGPEMESLRLYHLISLGLMLALAVQQMVSYKAPLGFASVEKDKKKK